MSNIVHSSVNIPWFIFIVTIDNRYNFNGYACLIPSLIMQINFPLIQKKIYACIVVLQLRKLIIIR